MEYIKINPELDDNIQACAWYPVIEVNPKILKNKKLYDVVINHERIHLEQQKELLIIFFYLLYYLEFIYHYLRTGNAYKAYRSISFEKECYKHQRNLKYLSKRVRYNYLWKTQ